MSAGSGSSGGKFGLIVRLGAAVIGIAVCPLHAEDWRPVTAAELRNADDRSWATWPASESSTAQRPAQISPMADRAVASSANCELSAATSAAPTESSVSDETERADGPSDGAVRDHRPSLPELSIPGRSAVADPLANFPGTAELSRIAVATGFLVVLAALSLAVYRHRRGWGGAGRALEPGLILNGSVSLGARNGLHLVSVTNRSFLVAVDARGVSCITPVPSNFGELYPLDAVAPPSDDAAASEFPDAPLLRKG